MSEIIIDDREKLPFRNVLKEYNIAFKVNHLKYGDIWILKNGSPRLIIERKTYDDLESSIKDGRSHCQAFNLKEIDEKSKIMVAYLVEVKINAERNEDMIMQAMINKMIRDGLRIIHTRGPEDTARHLKYMAKCIAKHGTYKTLEKKKETFTSTIKLPKCSNKNDKKCLFITQLRVFPGVSDSIATAIAGICPGWLDLLLLFKKHGELALASLAVTKKRKIGKALSRKIFGWAT